MSDPASAIISWLGHTKKLVEYVFELKGVSDEARNIKKILQLLQADLNRLRRYVSPDTSIQLDYLDRIRVNEVICSTNSAIAQVAKPVAKAQQDIKKYGTIRIHRRIEWTITDGDAIKSNETLLDMCHRRVLAQLNHMDCRYGSPQIVSPGSTTPKYGWWDDSHKAEVQQLNEDDLDDDGMWEEWLGSGDEDGDGDAERGGDDHDSKGGHDRENNAHLHADGGFSWLKEKYSSEKINRRRQDGHNTMDDSGVFVTSDTDQSYSWLRDKYSKP